MDNPNTIWNVGNITAQSITAEEHYSQNFEVENLIIDTALQCNGPAIFTDDVVVTTPLQIGTSNNNNQYIFPNTIGQPNQVLAVPSSGANLEWVDSGGSGGGVELVTAGSGIIVGGSTSNPIIDIDPAVNVNSVATTSLTLNSTSLTAPTSNDDQKVLIYNNLTNSMVWALNAPATNSGSGSIGFSGIGGDNLLVNYYYTKLNDIVTLSLTFPTSTYGNFKPVGNTPNYIGVLPLAIQPALGSVISNIFNVTKYNTSGAVIGYNNGLLTLYATDNAIYFSLYNGNAGGTNDSSTGDAIITFNDTTYYGIETILPQYNGPNLTVPISIILTYVTSTPIPPEE